MFKKVSTGLLLAAICLGQSPAFAGGYFVNGKLVGARDQVERTGTLPSVGNISYFNEGGYVAKYELRYLSKGKWVNKAGTLPVGQRFHSHIDPYASNISFKVDGIAVLDPLDLRQSFSRGENVQHCYKSWGTIFGTEWAPVSC